MFTRLRALVASALDYIKHPHLSEHRAFLTLFILNTAVFILECTKPGLMTTFALKSQDWGTLTGLAQIVTSMFTHAGFEHYFWNMLIVTPFAFYLERRIGSLRFLCLWLLSGIGSALCFAYTPHLMTEWACLGASGACFGVIGAALWLVDEHPVARALALFVLCALVWPNYCMTVIGFAFPSATATAGHLGGFATGLLCLNEMDK